MKVRKSIAFFMIIFCLFYILTGCNTKATGQSEIKVKHSDASNIQNQSSTIPQYNPNVLMLKIIDLLSNFLIQQTK